MNDNTPDATGGREDAPLPPAVPDPTRKSAAVVAIALVAGLLAGGVSWGIGEPLVEVFQPPREKTIQMGREVWTARTEDQAAADSRNATLAFTLMGTIIGAGLGLRRGLARRSVGAGIKAGLAAMVLGGVLTAASCLASLPVYFRAEVRSRQEALPRPDAPLDCPRGDLGDRGPRLWHWLRSRNGWGACRHRQGGARRGDRGGPRDRPLHHPRGVDLQRGQDDRSPRRYLVLPPGGPRPGRHDGRGLASTFVVLAPARSTSGTPS